MKHEGPHRPDRTAAQRWHRRNEMSDRLREAVDSSIGVLRNVCDYLNLYGGGPLSLQVMQECRSAIADLRAALAELTTAQAAVHWRDLELDRLRQDAERYWWLRRERYDDELPSVQSVSVGCIGVTLEGNDLDAAIDAAMAKEKRDE